LILGRYLVDKKPRVNAFDTKTCNKYILIPNEMGETERRLYYEKVTQHIDNAITFSYPDCRMCDKRTSATVGRKSSKSRKGCREMSTVI
jgi:hypothetical protein